MDNSSPLQKCQDFIAILWYICQTLFWRSVIYTRHYYLLLTDPRYKPIYNTNPSSHTPSKDEIYADKYLPKFQATFEEGCNINVNENVHRVFYDAKELKSELDAENNQLEIEWRRRVLHETTPRGNVVMYYDPFRLAFVYYADTHIPYPILNAAAMRYVLMFRCRDLFVDEFVYPIDHTSPLISILIEPKKPDTTQSDNKPVSQLPANMKGAPFAKLKSNMTSKEAVAGVKRVSETTQRIKNAQASDKKKIMNAFVCLGKIMDFPLFQITKPKPVQLPQGKPLSYADFVKSKKGAENTTASLFSVPPLPDVSSASESDEGSEFEIVQ